MAQQALAHVSHVLLASTVPVAVAPAYHAQVVLQVLLPLRCVWFVLPVLTRIQIRVNVSTAQLGRLLLQHPLVAKLARPVYLVS